MTFKTTAYLLVLIVCCPFTNNTVFGGVVFDATTDFSTASNGTGAWRYSWSNDTSRDGNYELFGQTGPLGTGPGSGSPVWHADAGAPTAQRPYLGINTTGELDGSTWQQGELGFHPGQSGGGTDPSMAILTFTSPITGFANIIFDIEMGLNGNISWFIDQNTDAGNLASGSMSSISETASFSIADLWVNKNDNLNFIVASNGNPGSDLVVIKQAQIELNAVPEPSSAMLVIFFLGTIGIYRYWSESLRLNSRLATTP